MLWSPRLVTVTDLPVTAGRASVSVRNANVWERDRVAFSNTWSIQYLMFGILAFLRIRSVPKLIARIADGRLLDVARIRRDGVDKSPVRASSRSIRERLRHLQANPANAGPLERLHVPDRGVREEMRPSGLWPIKVSRQCAILSR